jgi:selenocysteine-specific elongation factor
VLCYDASGMKSIIVGTAGHIDHGKTALVKALTGIDTDRLEEEKRRGITIDLGFAHMALTAPGGEAFELGFVDVPGHERFVRNMLAGVGGIDLVLLVIAADESIKPQTREHFEILDLLGVDRGITVLTKSDAVEREMLDVVRLEVEEFLRGTFLDAARSPIVPVSSRTGAGLDELKRALLSSAAKVAPRDSQALARLPIDRVFTIKGFGTVVTGTLTSGTIHREEELEVFPTGQRVRVRGVQVHGQNADMAVAGQRTALNLAGTSTADLARGMTLAPPLALAATRIADVRLRLLASASRGLKDRSRVHFHAQTMETVGEIIFLRSLPGNAASTPPVRLAEAKPGSELLARIKLPHPALLLPGDRFIVRRFSPVVTIGGGIVLDASPIPGSKQLLVDRLLEISAAGTSAQVLASRIARRGPGGLPLAQAVAETGWRRQVIESHLAGLPLQGAVLRFGDLLLHQTALAALKSLVTETVSSFHEKNPLVRGMGKEALREALRLSPEILAVMLEVLPREKKLEVEGDILRLPGRGVVMKDEEARSKQQIEAAFATAGLKVPALHEVLGSLKVDRSRAQKIMTLLLREKILIKISEDLVFHRGALDELRRQVAAQKSKSPTIDVAAFKEMAGVSRKYAIPLLEYLDRERVTKRVGDTRQIL